MNYTQHEAAEQNCKVLAGLRDLFQLLDEHGAIIGRNSARIVVDLSKAPRGRLRIRKIKHANALTWPCPINKQSIWGKKKPPSH